MSQDKGRSVEGEGERDSEATSTGGTNTGLFSYYISKGGVVALKTIYTLFLVYIHIAKT